MSGYEVERNGSEAAHGIDNVGGAELRHNLADFLDRIQNAGRGLAVDDGGMRIAGMRGQVLCYGVRTDLLVFRRVDNVRLDAVNARDLRDAAAVGAVHQDQQAAVSRNGGRDHGLNGERSAALHQNALVAVIRRSGAADRQQTAADAPNHFNESAIARPGVVQHGRLYGRAGGKRARCKEELVAGR